MSLLKPGKFLFQKRRFKILELFAVGGFSEIYLARDIKNNRRVIVKIFIFDKFSDIDEMEEYWLREKAFINIQSLYPTPGLKLIDSISNITNPNNPMFLIITNYVEGQTFEDWIPGFWNNIKGDRYRYLARRIFIPICDYFQYIHHHGLIHCDFSPSNILIKKKKETGKIFPVVLDWGASVNFDPGNLKKTPPHLKYMDHYDKDHIYTEGYTPPEVEQGKIPVPQSDIYSFGAIMYYGLSGGIHPKAPIKKGDYILALQEINEDCPEKLNDIVMECTQYEPRNRYHTFSEIKKGLQEFFREGKNTGQKE